MIEIQHLQKRFGDVTAVNGVSFTAPDAAITGLLGANGAGKTTTLGMITGLLAPDSGTVSIGGTASNGRDRRSVIAVDQIVSNARMLRVFFELLFKELGGRQISCVTLVGKRLRSGKI